ncbi:hypothetical protein B0H16DRAFT_1797469 [Mycena metata]|uniref:3'-5' exonuclease domain-containing protein n=1 Tax=Mycena metata TaxID=1033252 RepID=A0AAD7HF92_9AGAR|nr:hypothetical protein B0H16DRAFT_1797469 [Mycena metata]
MAQAVTTFLMASYQAAFGNEDIPWAAIASTPDKFYETANFPQIVVSSTGLIGLKGAAAWYPWASSLAAGAGKGSAGFFRKPAAVAGDDSEHTAAEKEEHEKREQAAKAAEAARLKEEEEKQQQAAAAEARLNEEEKREQAGKAAADAARLKEEEVKQQQAAAAEARLKEEEEREQAGKAAADAARLKEEEVKQQQAAAAEARLKEEEREQAGKAAADAARLKEEEVKQQQAAAAEARLKEEEEREQAGKAAADAARLKEEEVKQQQAAAAEARLKEEERREQAAKAAADAARLKEEEEVKQQAAAAARLKAEKKGGKKRKADEELVPEDDSTGVGRPVRKRKTPQEAEKEREEKKREEALAAKERGGKPSWQFGSPVKPSGTTRRSICVIKSVNEINTAMRTIIQDIPDNSNQQRIVIFLDSEWNVEISDRGYLTGRGQTAVLQIAYKKMVYIIQLGAMIAGGQIASVLTQVLESPQILKVGRAVSGDLKYLQQATSSPKPFVGAVDLAKMAKDRLVISNAKIGLADLCAVSLGLRLDKNVPERISSAWSNEDLSSAQIRYAALDVHACSRIYDFLSGIPIPALLPASVEIGAPVLLFNDDRTRLIARGSIEQLTGSFDTGKTHRDGTSDIINISASRCLVQISEVVVPAAILKTHKQALSLFGLPPFSAVCLRNHLRLALPVALPQISVVGTAKETLNSSVPLADLEINTSGTSNILPELSSSELESDPSGFGAVLLEEVDTAVPHNEALIRAAESDTTSQQIGEDVLATAAAHALVWLKCIRSRVLKDPFHIFNMFYISAAHGLRIEFARALRDAIFIPDSADKARIVAWGLQQKPPRSWDDMLRTNPDWVWRRCKRIIPPPEQLHGDVAEVFRTYGPLKDATTGLPLFNSAASASTSNRDYLSIDAYEEQMPRKVVFTPIYALTSQLRVLRFDM